MYEALKCSRSLSTWLTLLEVADPGFPIAGDANPRDWGAGEGALSPWFSHWLLSDFMVIKAKERDVPVKLRLSIETFMSLQVWLNFCMLTIQNRLFVFAPQHCYLKPLDYLRFYLCVVRLVSVISITCTIQWVLLIVLRLLWFHWSCVQLHEHYSLVPMDTFMWFWIGPCTFKICHWLAMI